MDSPAQMTLDQFLKEMGLTIPKKPIDRTPTDQWWKRKQECPH